MLQLALREDGFAFIGAGVMQALLGGAATGAGAGAGEAEARAKSGGGTRATAGVDQNQIGSPEENGDRDVAAWQSFAGSWASLTEDSYLAQVGLRRRRRHAVFHVGDDGELVRSAHQPHYQSRDYNTLQGGIERWFDPILPEVSESVPMRRLLGFAHALFGSLAPQAQEWEVEVHQFRIEALPEQHGQPTPEGMHRDGVNFVMVVLLDRHNITSGTTSIHTLEGGEIGSFTLTRPLDTAFVDDGRVYHGVTAVAPLDPTQPAWRDVLVVTFRATPAS